MSSKGPVQRTFKHDFRVFLAWPLVCNVCSVYTSRLRLRENERNNSQQCWELLRTCWQRCANGCNNSQQCWDLQCIVGGIQPISLCKPCVMSVRGPNNVGRAVQTDPTLLRYASAITEQKKCWELLANNVALVCTGLDTQRQPTTSSTVEYQSLISFRRILSRLHFFRRLRHMLHSAFHCTKYF